MRDRGDLPNSHKESEQRRDWLPMTADQFHKERKMGGKFEC
jgi:hypothetical protein